MLKEKLSELFEYYGIEKSNLILCRKDGIPLYFHNGNLEEKTDAASMGALISGLWQAANTLASFIPKTDQEDWFRLSYDTSSKGIYVLPVQTIVGECYLGLVYHGTLNPAPLKNKLRLLTPKLIDIVNAERPSNTGHSDKQGDYLFKDITDSEIEKMFAAAKLT